MLQSRIYRHSPKNAGATSGHRIHVAASGTKQRRRPLESQRVLEDDGSGWQGGKPSAALEAQIKKDFGSLDAFKERFNKAATGRFGSGWAWMILTSSGLQITSTPNQDNPLMDVVEVRGQPLLALDVWEHAYYLKYKYKRADYLNAWWTVVNWNEVNHLFEVAKKDQHKRIINPQH